MPCSDSWGAAGGQVIVAGAGTGNLAEAFNGLLAEWVVSSAPAAGERPTIAANMRDAFGVAA